MLTINLSTIIPIEYAGKRLDQALAMLFPAYSRENLKQWILNGSCLINNQILAPKYKIKGGETVIITANLTVKNQEWLAQDLPLNIIYEDQDILVLNKPDNLVMHPGSGNWSGTLLNALLNYHPELKFIPRAGIVHRLDKNTSGIVIIAKTLPAYNNLIVQFKNRTIIKTYEAIIIGQLIAGGTLNAPIGRHPRQRLKMDITTTGKPAVTHYRVLKKFKNHTHVKLEIETGRTHQIRVHMNHINHPILGDRLYAPRIKHNFPRTALHAKELRFKHPIDNRDLHFTLDLPKDLQDLLGTLNEHN